ncbi:helix-turn-helix transcriptional regulator [Kitasatospora saccharophila]|uniref:Helix-turn-helix transcriptional regulator n=1 Tax=Kitasatospora saccharophila TaxID=407973 RepID=A0ABP5HUW5_9ACTN
MNRRADLGAFLRSRRARIRPEEAGLRSFGERRRVPGLRREELAQLAGVSVDYYTRFEQGRAENVSDAVVDAVASALRLDAVETGHLHRLVRPAGAGGRPAPAQRVRPGLRRLMDSMPHTPAYVVGRRTDVLAWNAPMAAMMVDFAALPAGRLNKAWLVFCHEELRGRFVDWEAKARDVVGYLRLDHGRHPEDPAYPALIGELSDASPEFGRLWEQQEIREKTHGSYRLRHPAVGGFTVAYESLTLPGDPDQTLVTYTAEEGSPSQAALRLLAERRPVPVGSGSGSGSGSARS